MICKFCKASYDGHVTKICAACMAPTEVCLSCYVTKICAACMAPTEVCLSCYDGLDKVVCPECVRDAVANDCVDVLAESIRK